MYNYRVATKIKNFLNRQKLSAYNSEHSFLTQGSAGQLGSAGLS
jgi:hypothetical protein